MMREINHQPMTYESYITKEHDSMFGISLFSTEYEYLQLDKQLLQDGM